MQKLKLTIELVPETCFYQNVRAAVSKKEWDIIRFQVYKAANYICEICGGIGAKHPVEAHEIFNYDDKNKIQTLTKIMALCPNCHQCKHIGLAQLQGKFEQALDHLMKINQLSKEKAIKYINKQFVIWKERSKYQWTSDLSLLKNYDI